MAFIYGVVWRLRILRPLARPAATFSAAISEVRSAW
jgi:hypothetical protein